MKTAYNFAYVQLTETFTFTFTQQVIIVYVYLCSNFQDIVVYLLNLANCLATIRTNLTTCA